MVRILTDIVKFNTHTAIGRISSQLIIIATKLKATAWLQIIHSWNHPKYGVTTWARRRKRVWLSRANFAFLCRRGWGRLSCRNTVFANYTVARRSSSCSSARQSSSSFSACASAARRSSSSFRACASAVRRSPSWSFFLLCQGYSCKALVFLMYCQYLSSNTLLFLVLCFFARAERHSW